MRVRNAGNEGVENLTLTVHGDGQKLILIKTPSVTTVPNDLISSIIVKQIETSQQDKDERDISLLNPEDSVEFSYVAYSTERILKATFTASVRKKDWVQVKEGQPIAEKQLLFLNKPPAEWTGSDILFMVYLVAFMFATLQGMFNYVINTMLVRRVSRYR